MKKFLSGLQALSGRSDFQVVLFFIFSILFIWPFLGTVLLSSIRDLYLYFYIVWGAVVLIHLLGGLRRNGQTRPE